MDALITVEGVEKDFGNQVKALDQVIWKLQVEIFMELSVCPVRVRVH